ncbi:MAG: dihydropteroate synthase [candidate division Zixibacteria bacterium]|nr:dihydropteroate synthase [candidate division Zixibacteria bacterium]
MSKNRPLVMGILNITPDSFSDGNKYLDTELACEYAFRMASDGADIIDIGGESSRPGAEPITIEEEQKRILPVLKKIRHELSIPISVDTYHSETAQKAIDLGADIINDISALRFDSEMINIIINYKVPVILMHMKGTPRDMQKDPFYQDCIKEIVDFFDERIAYCKQNGIDKNRLIIDPGIGFGKRLADNLVIMKNIDNLKKFDIPVMIGTSRKSFIGMITKNDNPASDRIGGSISSAVASIINGANIVRVHDVKETVEAVKVLEAIRGN